MIRPRELKDDDFWRVLVACREGDLQGVQELVARRPELARREYNYTPPIHFAVREGHLDVVRYLVENGADVNAYRTYPFQDSLLTMAQDREHHDVAEFLKQTAQRRFPVMEGLERLFRDVEAGESELVQAALEQRPELARGSDDTGDTALHRAAAIGNLPIMTLLLDKGAPVDLVRADGSRPIHCALGRGRKTPLNSGAAAGLLLGRGAEYNIYLAAVFGDSGYVRRALEADPNLANFADTPLWRPLSAAARRNDLAMVELLLRHGANPSLPEEGAPLGQAVWIAVYQGQREMAKLLLEHGANPNTAPESSGSALMHTRKDPEMRRLLLEFGADEETDKQSDLQRLIQENKLEDLEAQLRDRQALGERPEMFWNEGILAGPSNSGNAKLVRLLMRYGARVPAVSKWGRYYYFKHAEIAGILLNGAMEPNHMNWHSVTMLHDMAHEGSAEKIELLLDHGADIDAIDEEYRSTPLGVACRWGKLDVVNLLLDNGADPNRAGAKWATPLAWARKKGHADIEQRLQMAGARA